MLLRLKIKNFLSFGDEVEFNMFPNLKRKGFVNHIYNTDSEHDVPVLKQAAIYGANASGKSNLLKAVKFLRDFVIEQDFLQDVSLDNYFYKLVKVNNSPINLEIEFKSKKEYYIYKAEISNKNISEALFLSGLGKRDDELIFDRKNQHLSGSIAKSQEIKDAIHVLLRKNRFSSIFSLNSRFPLIKNKQVDDAFFWFKYELQIFELYRQTPSTIDRISTSKDFHNFIESVFSNLELGIESVDIHEEPINLGNEESEIYSKVEKLSENPNTIPPKLAQFNNLRLSKVITKKGDQFVAQYLIFKQIGENGYATEMKIENQSEGTSKILDLLPQIYDLINSEKVVFIDEIENSIHPLLIYKLMEYFSKTQSKGQLIYTTHETILLDQQYLMRPDEVWFTEKINGKTNLYSLNDFKEHNTLNTQNGYLAGRYGAIPQIGSLEK